MRTRKPTLPALRACALLLIPALALAADPTTQPAKPTQRTPNCTAGGCHAKEKSYKVLHGPNALGACDTCHTYVDEAKHTFKLKREGKELCEFCHVGRADGKVVHKPVADGQCLACHNPHGAENKTMLRQANMAQLCAQCHQVTKDRSHLHGPVAAGSCAACHNSHTANLPKLLVAQGRDLCLGCHDQMSQQLAKVKSLHKPVEGDCLQCHEPHASNQLAQLKQAPLDLCESCHEPIKKLVTTAAFKHSVVTDKTACLNCHTPHGSDLGKLMKAEPVKVCLNCHSKPVAAPDKHVVAAVAELGDPKMFKHGPAKEGNCTGCHDVHGGPNSRLLDKPYSTAFYEGFDLQKFALCFSCHDQQLVLLPTTTGLTGFRNGDKNLHFVHVNKAEQGRSCRACHSTHASAHPVHIRDSVPYGKWEMPLNYQPTKTGGSCAPGCHKELAYDRDHAVKQETPTPPAPPATAPAAAK